MRRFIPVAVSATLLFVAPQAHAAKTSCHKKALLNAYSANYHVVAKTFTKRTPGRNIRKWGLSSNQSSQCHHLRQSLNTLRAMRFPGNRMLTPGQPHVPPAGTRTLHAGGTLNAIAQCESGGDPTTNTGNGFYGKYQFTLDTWKSVGGSGNPANASEAEQDTRAAILYSRRGAQPWPVCGR